MTPFVALLGFSSPRVLDYVFDLTKVSAVDAVLHDRSVLLDHLKHNLIST